MAPTHRVFNQPPPFEDRNLFEIDLPLQEGLERGGGLWARDRVNAYAARMGSARVMELGREANRHEPELRTFDRFGHRIDEVTFHPAWHELMGLAMEHEVHCLPWRETRSGAHVARSILHSLLSQAEAGHGCPITMTFASVPALQAEPGIARTWIPRVLETRYDPSSRPADQKSAATLGMAMTEKQGGSDVRANTTAAHLLTDDGSQVELVGHKWFCSAPMSDAFLTLAKRHEEAPPTCYLVPRWRPDGTRNAFHIQRLKDKMGNRSNASSEIEYDRAFAWRVGEEDRGIRTIIEMVHHTRLDCVSGSTGLMRQALSQALHHARHRVAFGRRLAEQPLMRQVLADLALESEAATVLMVRLAKAYDVARLDDGDPEQERHFARIATAVGKYWVCKRAPQMIGEAMECLGGNGYAEEASLARLYREAPVNAIWEGSGNVICLDVLRALAREPETGTALMAEIELGRGGHPDLDAAIDRLRTELADPEDTEARARRVVELMALTLQGSLLVRNAPSEVTETFCRSRLRDPGHLFGTLALGSADPALEILLRRALPE